MTMNRKLFAKGFRHGIPIGLGYLSVAFTFGMKAVADGLSPLEALLISMTNVTSAGQFAGLPLILAQASYLEVALTQLIINLRYALMSLSISQKMDSDMNTPRRLLFSFMNADEIFAVAFRRRIKAYSTFASLDRGVNVGASKRKLGSRVKLTAFSG